MSNFTSEELNVFKKEIEDYNAEARGRYTVCLAKSGIISLVLKILIILR